MTDTIEWEAPAWPPMSGRPPAAAAPDVTRPAVAAAPRPFAAPRTSAVPPSVWRVPPTSAVLVLLPLRIFLAAGWLRAAVEKLTSAKWYGGSPLRMFLADHHSTALPYFRPVMERVFDPAAPAVAACVAVLELACGAALVAGRYMRVALYTGVALNVSFLLCGQVNPSAFYLVMEIALLFAIADGAIGVAPRLPRGRTLVAAAAWVVVSLTFVPFVRTMKPADVIADPAIMLAFLSVITAAGLVFRWVMAAPHGRDAGAVDRWTRRIHAWARANHADQRSSLSAVGRRAEL